MKTTRWCLTAFALAATIAENGCNICGAEEQHAVTISAGQDLLTITGDGVTRKAESVGRATSPPINAQAFDFVFNTLEGSRSGEGIVLSLSETSTSNEFFALGLALPVALNEGDVYQVGRTFALEPSLDGDPRGWGSYDLQQSSQAEVSFFIAAYTFPPPTFTTSFRAVTSTGTIRVAERSRGRLVLQLNLNFTDANGKTKSVAGRVQAVTEKVTPPCIS